MRRLSAFGVVSHPVHDTGNAFRFRFNPRQRRLYGLFFPNACRKHIVEDRLKVADRRHGRLHLVCNHRGHLTHDIALFKRSQALAIQPGFTFNAALLLQCLPKFTRTAPHQTLQPHFVSHQQHQHQKNRLHHT